MTRGVIHRQITGKIGHNTWAPGRSTLGLVALEQHRGALVPVVPQVVDPLLLPRERVRVITTRLVEACAASASSQWVERLR